MTFIFSYLRITSTYILHNYSAFVNHYNLLLYLAALVLVFISALYANEFLTGPCWGAHILSVCHVLALLCPIYCFSWRSQDELLHCIVLYHIPLVHKLHIGFLKLLRQETQIFGTITQSLYRLLHNFFRFLTQTQVKLNFIFIV
jgi:hypothetical protein